MAKRVTSFYWQVNGSLAFVTLSDSCLR